MKESQPVKIEATLGLEPGALTLQPTPQPSKLSRDHVYMACYYIIYILQANCTCIGA